MPMRRSSSSRGGASPDRSGSRRRATHVYRESSEMSGLISLMTLTSSRSGSDSSSDSSTSAGPQRDHRRLGAGDDPVEVGGPQLQRLTHRLLVLVQVISAREPGAESVIQDPLADVWLDAE